MTAIDILLLAGLCSCLWIAYRQYRLIYKPSITSPIAISKRPTSNESGIIPQQPVINVIFSTEAERNELVEELADLFLKGRTFYYNGQDIPETSLSEKGNEENEDVFIQYDTVSWDTLTTIEI